MVKNELKNSLIFEADVNLVGSYIYSQKQLASSFIATSRQTKELVSIIKKYSPKPGRVLDVGCGDGTFSLDLFTGLKPVYLLGVDPAKKAIQVAQRKISQKQQGKISFRVGDIYLLKNSSANQFDLAVIRGVLHHIPDPELAIVELSNIFPNIAVLEPNGLNPILKLIEKISPYHRSHKERSFAPGSLKSWFKKAGYKAVEEKYFGLVPYFCPKKLAQVLKTLEPVLEKIPFVKKYYCGTYLVFLKK